MTTTPTESKKKILIVDDEPDIRNFLSACLEDAGFLVNTAKDGLEAMERVAADPPDLITLDLVMPRRSGVWVIRELQKNEQWATIPVIVITAHARDEFGTDEIKALSAFTANMRPRYTIEKPVTPEKIVRAIRDVLELTETPVQETKISSEKDLIVDMINNADPDTLKQIRTVLNRKK
jgi:CheY-like chemotaxis protein